MRLPAFTISLRPDGHLHYPSGASQRSQFQGLVQISIRRNYKLGIKHFSMKSINQKFMKMALSMGLTTGTARGRIHKDLDNTTVKAWDPAFQAPGPLSSRRFPSPNSKMIAVSKATESGTQGGKLQATSGCLRANFLRGIPRLRWRVLPTEWTSSDFIAMEKRSQTSFHYQARVSASIAAS